MEKRQIYRIFAGSALFVPALLIKPDNPAVSLLIFVIPYLTVGYDVLFRAGRNILQGQVFDENFLMGIATIGAFAVGEYPEAVGVMLFYQIGEYFQNRAVNRSRQSIAALMDIRPEVAFAERNGILEKLPPEEVKAGETIVVSPGEKIPLDGVVTQGSSSVDTSALTGEPIPKDVFEGSTVLGGSVNQTGLLKIRVEKEYGESTVSKILELVENSAARKAGREKFITKFARIYTPSVVIFAAALAFLPPLITGRNLGVWVYRALVFLVISCPCALVISVPLTFFGGIGGASRLGILIKGGNCIEALSRTETVVFDKTGTLTKGEFTVSMIKPAEDITEEKLLYCAAYAENFSSHPISKSIKTAYGKEIAADLISDVNETPGQGVSAVIGGESVLAGNAKLMSEHGINTGSETAGLAGSAVYVAVNGRYAGLIEVSDTAKPDSAGTIGELKTMGIKNTVILTGDKKESAEKTARSLGVDAVYAELLPSDKVDITEKLLSEKTKGTVLVYAGDGINDAPVLARADIGIAMGGFGSDAAIEAADAVIMTDEPSKIPLAIKLSRRTLRIAKQNIAVALVIKAAVLLLGAFGAATMWEAVFADVGVTIIAVINSMRAQRVVKLQKSR
jgi:Cd2+/Zn2+-exporting ATPase